MARVMGAKQKTLDILEERLIVLNSTKDDMILKANVQADELAGALVAVSTGKEKHKTVEKKAKVAEKKVADLCVKLEALRANVRRQTRTIKNLQDKLRAAAQVCASLLHICLLLFLKLPLLFCLLLGLQ